LRFRLRRRFSYRFAPADFQPFSASPAADALFHYASAAELFSPPLSPRQAFFAAGFQTMASDAAFTPPLPPAV